ncbi:hypothetical protein LTR53_011618 [Teratosphaeriaceae sp. CCFEE 6253]|nr:hypothetical protein LTR53_011618 [Teratosphaeriaceae sp. CCFEE 6253]
MSYNANNYEAVHLRIETLGSVDACKACSASRQAAVLDPLEAAQESMDPAIAKEIMVMRRESQRQGV